MNVTISGHVSSVQPASSATVLSTIELIELDGRKVICKASNPYTSKRMEDAKLDDLVTVNGNLIEGFSRDVIYVNNIQWGINHGVPSGNT